MHLTGSHDTPVLGSDRQATTLLVLKALGDSDATNGANTYFKSETTEITRGTKESAECAGRGLCDGDAGLCTCFTGYTGAACETQVSVM